MTRTPYIFSSESRAVGAVFIDTPGPVDFGRIITTSQQITLCSRCGTRVYTKAERDKSESDSYAMQFFWLVIIACIIFAIAVIADIHE